MLLKFKGNGDVCTAFSGSNSAGLSLWGTLKDVVYIRKPATLAELRACAAIAEDTFANIAQSVVQRTQKCIDADGICGLLVGHPFDTIKLRQQTFKTTGSHKIIQQTWKHEGFHGFYKGMGFPLIASGTLNSVFFGVYGNVLRYLQSNNNGQHQYRNIFFAGCIAGLAQIPLACPVELVKSQLQAQTGSAPSHMWETQHHHCHKGPINCLVNIFKDKGIQGLFRGFHVMIWRDSFSSGIYVLLYEWILSALQRPKDTIAIMVAGGLAGVVSWCSIMPLDVVKSRLQADDISNQKYKGIWDCAYKSYKEDGIKVFGRGTIMCMVRAFPVNAAIFLGYEWCLKLCKDISNYLDIKDG